MAEYNRIRVKQMGRVWWAAWAESSCVEYGPFTALSRDRAIRRARRWIAKQARERATEEYVRA